MWIKCECVCDVCIKNHVHLYEDAISAFKTITCFQVCRFRLSLLSQWSPFASSGALTCCTEVCVCMLKDFTLNVCLLMSGGVKRFWGNLSRRVRVIAVVGSWSNKLSYFSVWYILFSLLFNREHACYNGLFSWICIIIYKWWLLVFLLC